MLNKSNWVLGFSICLMVCISCTSGRKGKVKEIAGPDSIKASRVHHFRKFPVAKVLKHIKCQQDTNLSFSLYLPKGYDTLSKYQVTYFIDAHARGELPLQKYKELADKFKMVFVGSENSQNGLTQNNYTLILKDLMQSASDMVNINEKDIYLAGFSGGAKVAGMEAIGNNAISSVIGCAAPLEIKDLGKGYFSYIGIVGLADFNYWDMVDLDNQFDKTPLNHALLNFNGKHEWPDERTMENALALVLIESMKNKSIPMDMTLVDNYLHIYEDNANKNLESGNIKEAIYWNIIIADYFGDIKNQKYVKKRIDSLKSTIQYIDDAASDAVFRKNELDRRANYIVLAQKPETNWQKEINLLSMKSDPGISWRNKRLLAYINMLAYMKSMAFLKENHLEQALSYIKLFRETDSKNPDGAYLMADYYAIKGQKAQAIAALNEAIKLGYDDFAHFLADPMLVSLKDEPAFRAVFEKLAN